MFNDDVSEIDPSWCNVLTSTNTLVSYHNNRRIDYSLSGGRWIAWRDQTAYNSYDISNYECIDVTTLRSNAQFEPIFYSIALLLFVLVILFFRWSVRGIIGRY